MKNGLFIIVLGGHEPRESEMNALCLLGIEKNPILRTCTKQPDDKFGKLLFAIGRTKDSESDSHLFESLKSSLNDKNMNPLLDIKSHIQKYFAEKRENFCKVGIFELPKQWRKIAERNG